MRGIKCRGKDEEGQWHYGYYVFTNDMHRIIYEDRECFYVEEEVIPETVGQYTGINDSNANEIYEGDIIKSEDGIVSKIIYDEASFKSVWMHNDHLVNCILDNLFIRTLKPVVVGNIYENPELLEN